jgi:hypothetical protein
LCLSFCTATASDCCAVLCCCAVFCCAAAMCCARMLRCVALGDALTTNTNCGFYRFKSEGKRPLPCEKLTRRQTMCSYYIGEEGGSAFETACCARCSKDIENSAMRTVVSQVVILKFKLSIFITDVTYKNRRNVYWKAEIVIKCSRQFKCITDKGPRRRGSSV